MLSAYVTEVFASLEGEGVNAGRPATFLRFSGCNLACSYCDTEYARRRSPTARIDAVAGHREVANPVGCQGLVDAVVNAFPDTMTAVLTGGEPLLQAEFMVDLARRLRTRGIRIHLETNGTLAGAYLRLADSVDFVCADVKLPSTQHGRDLLGEHSDFLRALKGRRAAVKIVVVPESGDDEIEEAIGIVARVNRHLPVIIQPAFSGPRPLVGADRLRAVHSLAAKRLSDVAVSFQVQKMVGMR